MTKPFYQDNHVTLWNKSCTDMSELPDNSVQACVTSPPYWGLRKYAGDQDLIWGGDLVCEHQWNTIPAVKRGHPGDKSTLVGTQTAQLSKEANASGDICSRCGAWCGSLGLEPTPDLYIEHSLVVLREIRRVLRSDGVLFWNLGDTYITGKGSCLNPGGGSQSWRSWNKEVYPSGRAAPNRMFTAIPGKNLALIPHRFALAAQADGWIVRIDIIWNKLNPMPESVEDRPTESHEHIFMLVKSPRYFWDREAVKEESTERSSGNRERFIAKAGERCRTNTHLGSSIPYEPNGTGRNLRSVWTFPTEPCPFRGVHFATFPERIPEICIKAATPEYGCCDKCGTPYERIIEKGDLVPDAPGYKPRGNKRGDELVKNAMTPVGEVQGHPNFHYERTTLGWRQACKCQDSNPVPSTVLDPFAGSGTTLWVAKNLGRKSAGYELSEEYCNLDIERNRQQILELTP